MSTTNLSPIDLRMREDVVRQLDWDPSVDASDIGVSARDGVVALTGSVDTYAGKLAAERVVKRVRGVRGVANDLDVRLRIDRTDSDIAHDAIRALEIRASVPDTVQAAVHDGHITLTGRVRTLFQAREAEKAVRYIRGVQGVFNHIEVPHDSLGHDVNRRITEALHRDAELDARRVTVAVTATTATLTGVVASWAQRDAAERAAASAPGIARVINRIEVHVQEADEIC